MRHIAILLSLFLLAGCAADGGASPFFSTQYPPGAASANSEPQAATSFPRGAVNFSTSPALIEPDIASVTLGRH